jgi:hypothetical protein
MPGLVGPGFALTEPPFVNVYELGSSIERMGAGDCVAGREGAAVGGGGGAGALGADGGGGGGGAPGDDSPKAFRAACSASEGVCPFVGAFGAGRAGADGGLGGPLLYL